MFRQCGLNALATICTFQAIKIFKRNQGKIQESQQFSLYARE